MVQVGSRVPGELLDPGLLGAVARLDHACIRHRPGCDGCGARQQQARGQPEARHLHKGHALRWAGVCLIRACSAETGYAAG
jgi:hypothetical protein